MTFRFSTVRMYFPSACKTEFAGGFVIISRQCRHYTFAGFRKSNCQTQSRRSSYTIIYRWPLPECRVHARSPDGFRVFGSKDAKFSLTSHFTPLSTETFDDIIRNTFDGIRYLRVCVEHSGTRQANTM